MRTTAVKPKTGSHNKRLIIVTRQHLREAHDLLDNFKIEEACLQVSIITAFMKIEHLNEFPTPEWGTIWLKELSAKVMEAGKSPMTDEDQKALLRIAYKDVQGILKK